MASSQFQFQELLEIRQAEKAEAVRFARAGFGVHDSELVYADDVDKIGTGRTLHPRDPFCKEWGMFLPEIKP